MRSAHVGQIFLEHRDQDDPVLDTDPEESDEADTRGNTEVRSGEIQGCDATHDGKGYVDKDQQRVLEIAEHADQQEEDQGQADGDDLRQAFLCALLVFEVALEGHAIAAFQVDGRVTFLLGLRDGAAHVATADGEFQCGISFIVVAIDQCGTGSFRDIGNFLDGYLTAAHGGDEEVANLIRRFAVFFGEADADIEGFDAFVERAGRNAAGSEATDGHTDDRIRLGSGNAIETHFTLVEIDIQLGLADVVHDTEVGDTLDVLQHIVILLQFAFHILQGVAEDLQHQATLNPGYGLFHVVADRLGEIEVYPRDNRQGLIHR